MPDPTSVSPSVDDACDGCLGPADFTLESGSFRDRDGKVFYHGGSVFRALREKAATDWRKLAATQFFSRNVAAGRIISTCEVHHEALLRAVGGADWQALLAHESVPFVSYPYEWCFGMLQDAALLQLDLLREALDEGLILKDASPFNVQWRGPHPVFIDIPSFETWRPGEMWVGYGQFCSLFLYPLMLQAYKGASFQPWLRGALDGLDPGEFNRLMGWRDLLRPGVFKHVWLHAWLQQRLAASAAPAPRQTGESALGATVLRNLIGGLHRLVSRLRWEPARSQWSDYAVTHSYSAADEDRKKAFIRATVGQRRWPLAWDLGANTGTYARLAAEHAETVVALDADHLAVDCLYRGLKAEASAAPRIIPLVGNLANPSPDLGWRGRERRRLEERGRPDLVLCLALIHHLAITANVPLTEFVDWLADLGGVLVIEFVTREDGMTRRLLQRKDDGAPDYQQPVFEAALESRFTVTRREALASGTRILYEAVPRS